MESMCDAEASNTIPKNHQEWTYWMEPKNGVVEANH